MAGLDRTLAEVIRKAIAGRLQDVHIALPGKVVRWDAAANLADVEVQVKHPVLSDDNAITYEDVGTLLGVPVVWPGAGGYVMTFPLAVGDTGQLIFNSTAIGEWRSSGQKSSPQDVRRLSLAWPAFHPGLRADNNKLAGGDVSARTGGIVIGKDGSVEQIRIQSGVIQAGASGVDAVALNTPLQAVFAALEAFNVAVAAYGAAMTTAASNPTYILFAPAAVAAGGSLATAASTLTGAIAALFAAVPSLLFKAK